MNIHISKIFVLCMIIGVFGIGTAMAVPSVAIDPASTTGLSPGDTLSVNIHVDPDGNGVSGGEICLLFDTAVLEVTDLTKGDMLGTDAFDTGSGYDNTAGTVTAVLARQGVTTPPTAAGTWATVTFQVKAGVADGTTTIAITSVGVVDGDFAPIIGITTTGGTATVGTPGGPSVAIDPASTTGLSPGDTLSVNIHVDPDGNGVSGGEICLLFDTAVLEVTDLTKGDMLGTDAFDTGSGYDNTAGTVTAVLARQGVTTPPTAAGTWATVTFQVKAGVADGTTTIAITSVGVVDGDFVPITSITTTDGTATVGGAAVPPTLVAYTITNTTIVSPQTTSIDVKFSERVSAIIKIEDASGNLVNVLYTSSGVTDPSARTWDGTDTDGATVPDGTYTVNVSGVSTTTGLSVIDTSKTINVHAAGAVSVTLYEGWNLIAVPVNDPTADTAAELAPKITGCKEVVKWDASTQTYVPYTKIGDDWTGTDFVITGGMGLFVSVEGDTTVGFTGDAWS